MNEVCMSVCALRGFSYHFWDQFMLEAIECGRIAFLFCSFMPPSGSN